MIGPHRQQVQEEDGEIAAAGERLGATSDPSAVPKLAEAGPPSTTLWIHREQITQEVRDVEAQMAESMRTQELRDVEAQMAESMRTQELRDVET